MKINFSVLKINQVQGNSQPSLFYYLLFGPPSFVYVLSLPMTVRVRRGCILRLITGPTTDAGTILVVRLSAATRIVPRPRSKKRQRERCPSVVRWKS